MLIPTSGCYGAICDAASEVNRPGFLADAFAAGQRDAIADGEADDFGLFYLNDALAHAAARGEILTWALIQDGVFCARVGMGEDSPEAPASAAIDPDVTVTADLDCTSGVFLLTSLGALGEPGPHASIAVAPGRWRVTVARDLAAEDAHEWLEGVEQYPHGEGPDWYVSLHRIE